MDPGMHSMLKIIKEVLSMEREMVEIFMGENSKLIPLEDYYEIRAYQCGYDSYEEMKTDGLFVEKPKTVFIA